MIVLSLNFWVLKKTKSLFTTMQNTKLPNLVFFIVACFFGVLLFSNLLFIYTLYIYVLRAYYFFISNRRLDSRYDSNAKRANNFGCLLFLMVPLAGVEPARYHYHWILSPARLPISPQRQNY